MRSGETFQGHFSHIMSQRLSPIPGLVGSLVIHGLLLATAIVFSVVDLSTEKKALPPMATPVTLASNPNTGAGKKRKAPVAGEARRKTRRKAEVKKTPTTKPKPAKKTTKAEIGLDRTKKKKKPPKTSETTTNRAERKVTKPDPQPVHPDPPARNLALGGLGGDEQSGISMDVGNPDADPSLEDIEFSSYYRLIHTQVSQRWVSGGLQGMTVVRFQVDRQGTISGAEVVNSSGTSFLDNAALRAVVGAELPPLPQGFREDILDVTLRFRHGSR